MGENWLAEVDATGKGDGRGLEVDSLAQEREKGKT